jgi:hypothetical protein
MIAARAPPRAELPVESPTQPFSPMNRTRLSRHHCMLVGSSSVCTTFSCRSNDCATILQPFYRPLLKSTRTRQPNPRQRQARAKLLVAVAFRRSLYNNSATPLSGAELTAPQPANCATHKLFPIIVYHHLLIAVKAFSLALCILHFLISLLHHISLSRSSAYRSSRPPQFGECDTQPYSCYSS